MEFPIPATVTEATPELVYDPYATIVYNSNPEFYGEVVPTTISADRVTSAMRNTEIWRAKQTKTDAKISSVQEYLTENYDEIGEEHANEIAELLGIDLSQTIDVEFTVTITATISVPVGTKAYDLNSYDFDVELSTTERDYEIEDYDADIQDITER